ncbi:MAG: replication factor C small subunit [Nitrosarchaeum sp.]|nr:replication factor C small subunit [Nitrosarchaeum sp.]
MEYAVWTEKYRPKNFADIKGQTEIVKRVSAFVKAGNMPHLLFAGPAGVGKTTLALVIAHELYKDTWAQNVLELNASDERGIDVVRVKVKDFARTRAFGNVPFKIIYLDECDALTKEAQQALRRTMENYTQTCRFILSCNYSSKIIDPIQSRCTLFKFKPLSKEELGEIALHIAREEDLHIDSQALTALYEASHGDARRAENILQSCSALSKKITPESIYHLASMARPQEMHKILELAAKGAFKEARDLLLTTMLEHGLSGIDVIKQLQTQIWESNLTDRQKLKVTVQAGEIEFRMTEGSDEFLQLESLLAFIAVEASQKHT